MTLNFGWGWKITLLYSSFVVLMLVLVIASTRQKFDLVSKDYYKDEIAFQNVLNADRNQAALSGNLTIRSEGSTLKIDFPQDFSGKKIGGDVVFYSAVDKDWDRSFPITTDNNVMTIDRNSLMHTIYKLKISYSVDGKSYYKENEINLTR